MLKLMALLFKEKWELLFPAFLAIYPILFFFGHNIQQASLSDLFLPLFLSLMIAGILWTIFRFLLKDALQAGMAVTFGLVVFFTYGHGIEFLESHALVLPLHRHYQIVPVLFCLWGYFLWMIRKRPGFLSGTAKFLTIMACLLTVINLVPMIAYYWQMQGRSRNPLADTASREGVTAPSPNTPLASQPKPDIYLIVLDEYAASATARELLGFDNSPFENRLRQYGFRIAGNAVTHTGNTATVMASVLNMERQETPAAGMEGVSYEGVKNNRVFSLLHSQGYRTIHFPILHYADVVSPMPHADVNVDPRQLGGLRHLGDFHYELLKTTLCRPFMQGLYEDDAQCLPALYTNHIFDQLHALPGQRGPKFVYAHVPCPHSPFVFDEAGNFIGYHPIGNEQYYLGQYKYVSRKVLAAIDSIFRHSENPPVVILLSDHGPRGKIAATIGNRHEHWQRVFFAAYFPEEKMREQITDTFSPIDTFRLILRHYFPNLPLSPRDAL